MQPRTFLFWTVPRWLHDCVYSQAYLEILYADNVVTQYDRKKGGKKSGKDGEKRAEEAMRKWKEKQEKKKAKQNISLSKDVLNKQ